MIVIKYMMNIISRYRFTDVPNAPTQVEKRHLLRSHLYIKMMILPRQARDKGKEALKKKSAVLSQDDFGYNPSTFPDPTQQARKNPHLLRDAIFVLLKT
jgi:hypothetical protein